MVLFFVASAVMYGVTYWTTLNHLESNIEEEVNTEISRYIGSYQSTQLGIKPTSYAFFIEQDGQKVAGNLTGIPEQEAEKTGALVEVDAGQYVDSPSIQSRGDIVGKTIELSDNTKLFIGKNSYDATSRQRKLLDTLFNSLILLMLIGGIGGLLISYRSAKRIHKITRVSKAIMAGNLQLRIPSSNVNDDIEDLATNLNQMLDKIDDLMQSIKQAGNNIAHDLRTPLTRLRGNLEVLGNTCTDDTARQLADNAINETDSILNTFNSLLRISQVESGTIQPTLQELNLTELANELIDFYEVLAEEKGQRICFDNSKTVFIQGDRSLISQAIVNILDNAIKYAPKDTEIKFELTDTGSQVSLSIKDEGHGVPDDNVDKITERFYRLETHREIRNGNGLGLSLVKAIMKYHRGELKIENNQGLQVTLIFPNPN